MKADFSGTGVDGRISRSGKDGQRNRGKALLRAPQDIYLGLDHFPGISHLGKLGGKVLQSQPIKIYLLPFRGWRAYLE